MFHLWTLLPALYTGWRQIRLLPLSATARGILFFLTVIIAEIHLIYRLVFGNMFSPELPRGVIIILMWLFGILVFFSVILLVRDLFQAFITLFSRRPANRFRLSGLMLLASSVLSGAAIYQAVRVPSVHQVDITLPGLPHAFDGYRIVQLTDIHASRLFTGSWVRQVVNKTNAVKPDLIVITGDIADGTVNDRKMDVAPLKQLHATEGVYAVTGNHEYYFDAKRWVKNYTGYGLHFLMNEHIQLYRHSDSITLAGITDEAARAYGEKGPDIQKALSGVPDNSIVILLSHRPKLAVEGATAGVSLQLSGHTHGGMLTGLDLAAAPANGGFVSGLYHVGTLILYVSNGTGLWNGFPFRLGKPSEITLITLHCSQEST